MNRKLGKPTDQRMTMIKNQAADLLNYGKIETTFFRAKEVAKYTEKLITLAINTYQDKVEIEKEVVDAKGNKSKVKSFNDGPKKLAARRKLMARLADVEAPKLKDETKLAYEARTAKINHPVIEKMFGEIAPKYAERAEKLGQGGGYTRIYRLGTRKGDGAEKAIVELI